MKIIVFIAMRAITVKRYPCDISSLQCKIATKILKRKKKLSSVSYAKKRRRKQNKASSVEY